MYERRQTKQITVGKVPVGGGAPITVQSMTTKPLKVWHKLFRVLPFRSSLTFIINTRWLSLQWKLASTGCD
jgi:hypothetical protein